MFSLRTLFVGVGISAFAFAALFVGNFWLMSAFVVFTLGVLCWAFLEKQTAFWRCLCVFGFLYLAISVASPFASLERILPSTRLHALIRVENQEPAPLDNQVLPGPLENPFAPGGPDTFGEDLRLWESKLMVLHCIVALLFGIVGGILYQWNTERRKGGA